MKFTGSSKLVFDFETKAMEHFVSVEVGVKAKFLLITQNDNTQATQIPVEHAVEFFRECLTMAEAACKSRRATS